ncbi:MAG: homocysteine S-methyltransferase family protein [Proteobacteria bacterium]|nr:homocysteine S-methyltransferase family protein [Pseudomonadota bacterium]
MKDLFDSHDKILMEGAIVTQLQHYTSLSLHPTLIHAPLIYDIQGREDLAALYKSYLDIALKAGLPFLMCSPTWLANLEKVKNSDINQNINFDAIKFMQEIKSEYHDAKSPIMVGGLLSCKGDGYKVEQGLDSVEARNFHSWQINQLAKASPDFIIAETLPCLEEAKGIAMALEETTIPYIISFVINREGCLLDKTSLMDAIESIDGITKRNPLGYMVNCSYPSFLCAEIQPKNLFNRLIGFLGNASLLNHCDLDNSMEIKSENEADWASAMLELNKKYKIKVLGGCCGTSSKHLDYLVQHEG